MNRTELHQAISEALSQLDTTNNRLYLHTEPISRLEVDLLRKQAIDCYDLINQLALVANQPLNSTDDLATKEKVNKESEETQLQELKTVNTADQKTEGKTDQEPKESKKKKEERKADKKNQDPIPEKEKPEQKPAEKVRSEVKESVKSEGGQQKDESDSVVEKYRTETTSVADRFTSQGIDDIKKAISISKRFEFQSALFDNDRVMYEKTIEYFNTASDQSEGLARFKEMMDAHNWENDSKLVQELEQLVERRYI